MSLLGQVFAACYDRLMAGPEKAVLRGRRETLVGRVSGYVLEIGGGTGANLPFYGADVDRLVITEPEEPMARRLERKLADYSLPARVVSAPAEELPLEDASFDFVVSTLVLCTVDDPGACSRGDPPAAQTWRPTRVSRACPLRRPQTSSLAGPSPRRPGTAGVRLSLQPPDTREHRPRRFLDRGARARPHAQGAADRASADRRTGTGEHMTTLGLDGVDLSYTDLGSGDPLLLVHGTGAYSAIWGEAPGQLAGSHRVIVYDRRGFGASQGELAHHPHQHTLDAAALLEHLGAVPAVVVGWSGGGPIALDLAATRPELVDSLVLIEPAVSLILAPSAGIVRMSAQMQFRTTDPAGRTRRRSHDVSLGQLVHHRRQRIRPAPARRAGGDAGAFPLDGVEIDLLMRPFPSTKALSTIGCPVTCLQGSLSDPVFPRAIRRLQRRLPQTKVVHIEGGAHMLHRDRPDEWVQAVLDAAH